MGGGEGEGEGGGGRGAGIVHNSVPNEAPGSVAMATTLPCRGCTSELRHS